MVCPDKYDKFAFNNKELHESCEILKPEVKKIKFHNNLRDKMKHGKVKWLR